MSESFSVKIREKRNKPRTQNRAKTMYRTLFVPTAEGFSSVANERKVGLK